VKPAVREYLRAKAWLLALILERDEDDAVADAHQDFVRARAAAQ
jgi:hypothetical protein